MSKKRGAPSKTIAERRASLTQIRLMSSEKTGFEEAAKLSGLSLSAWMRERLRSVAKRELESYGKTPDFLK